MSHIKTDRQPLFHWPLSKRPAIRKMVTIWAYSLSGGGFVATLQFFSDASHHRFALCAILISLPILLTSGIWCELAPGESDIILVAEGLVFLIGMLINLGGLIALFASFGFVYALSFIVGLFVAALSAVFCFQAHGKT